MKPGAMSPATIFGPRLASAHDPPAPDETTSTMVAGSSPAFFARAIPSLQANMCRAQKS